MPPFLKITSVAIFLLMSFCCCGQWHVVAVSTTGILINNSGSFYHRNNESLTVPKGGTITAEEARSIFALNIIAVDAKKDLFRGKVSKFKMTVYHHEGENTFDSNSEILTPEMEERLQKLQPGDKLYFDYIKTEMPDGSHPQAPMLGFIIK